RPDPRYPSFLTHRSGAAKGQTVTPMTLAVQGRAGWNRGMRREWACRAPLLVALLLRVALAAAAEQQLDVPQGYRALLFRPDHYPEQPRWPLLVYLHGAAERGDDLERAAVTGPPKEIRAGRALPMVVVAPLLPAGQQWDPARLAAVLDTVVAAEHIDPDRVY